MEIDNIESAVKEVGKQVAVVLVGDWYCSKEGKWDFKVEKNSMAKCIFMSKGMSYLTLREGIEKEYEAEGKGDVRRVAYWLPTEMALLSSGNTPPVSIDSDCGVATFMQIHGTSKGMTLCVSFKALESVEAVANSEKRDVRETNIIRLVDPSPSFASDDMMAEVGEGGAESGEARSDSVQILAMTQAKVVEEVGTENTRKIDLNSIYDAEMVTELERIEALAKEAQGWNKNKGKEKVGCGNDDVQDPAENTEWEPYGTDEEEDYNYDKWTALISREYGLSVHGEGVEQGETSNVVPLQCRTEDEREGTIGPLVEDMETLEVDGGRCEEVVGEDVDNEYEIQPTLANIYNEILEADSISAPDVEPCFGDELLQTQDLQMGVFDPGNDAIYIGRIFRNKEDMQTALSIYAIKRVFNFRLVKSDKARLIVRCVDSSCPWRVYGHVVADGTENIEIRTAILNHTCTVETRAEFGKKATCKVLAKVLRSKFTNGKVGPRAVDIPAIVLEEMQVSISYMKAWHGKEKALTEARGTEEESYNLLRGYLKLLQQTNEGTVTDVVCRKSGTAKAKFQYLFFAIGACIKAVEFMRNVIIVDATAIKAKFKGTLITASFQDGNFQVMPLGFGVVDGENDRSWTWFFSNLVKIIPDSDKLVIVSDRHSSIYTALRSVYPLAKHGACAVHLYRNIKARFRRDKGIPLLVSQAAFAYTIPEFRERFQEIEERSPLCATYLRGIGISHWTRAYSQGQRYNIMSSNVAESLNAALAKALEYPILTMVEAIRMMLMRWFYERRTKSHSHVGPVTPEVENILMKNLAASTSLTVFPASNSIYQVNTGEGDPYSVNLERRSCTCRVFDVLGIPCRHAVAAARVNGIQVHGMVNDFYKTEMWQEAYSNVVMPVPNSGETDAADGDGDNDMMPPQSKRPPGRPKKRRIPSLGEDILSRKPAKRTCSRCAAVGHNRATCTYAIP